MVFSHGPGAFLAAHVTRKWWGKELDPKKLKRALWVAGFFGLAIDFDLFYTWFFDASKTHHQYITHTPVLYIGIFSVLYLFGKLTKNSGATLWSKIILISGMAHMLQDSFIAGIMWLFPFSEKLYGLNSIDAIANSFFGKNGLFINLSTELLIILISLNVLLNIYNKNRKSIKIALVTIWVIAVTALSIFAQNTFRVGGNTTISDLDNDGIMNLEDRDLDCDGVENLYDIDANANGKTTAEDMEFAANQMLGVRYDPSRGSLYEFTRRAGFFNEKDVLYYSLRHAGIFMKEEFKYHRSTYSGGQVPYSGSVEDNDFMFSLENYQIFFEEYNLAISMKSYDLKKGDIVFFSGNAKKLNAGIIVGDTADQIIYMAPGEEVVKTGIEEFKQQYETWNIFRLYQKNLMIDKNSEEQQNQRKYTCPNYPK